MKVVLRGNSLYFECPASSCGTVRIPVQATPGSKESIWKWNGSLDKPTLHPSIKKTWDFGPQRKHNVCHFWIKDGVIQFLADCTHELKGQSVPMNDVTDEFLKFIPAE